MRTSLLLISKAKQSAQINSGEQLGNKCLTTKTSLNDDGQLKQTGW